MERLINLLFSLIIETTMTSGVHSSSTINILLFIFTDSCSVAKGCFLPLLTVV